MEPVAEHPDEPRPVTGLWRVVYIVAGLFFVGLAALGAVLPVLPTTPFLLLASYFFVRSSPALHRWLLRNRVFGPLLRDWQKHRAVRRPVKVTAVCVIPIVLTTSAALTGFNLYLTLMLAGLGLIGLLVVVRLPVIEEADGATIEAGVAEIGTQQTSAPR